MPPTESGADVAEMPVNHSGEFVHGKVAMHISGRLQRAA
jgi:hypothetical protein